MGSVSYLFEEEPAGRLSRDARWYSRERNGPVKARKFHRKQEYRKIQNKREEAVAGREEG